MIGKYDFLKYDLDVTFKTFLQELLELSDETFCIGELTQKIELEVLKI